MSSITQYRKMLFALFVSMFVIMSPGAFAQTSAIENDNQDTGDGGDGAGGEGGGLLTYLTAMAL